MTKLQLLLTLGLPLLCLGFSTQSSFLARPTAMNKVVTSTSNHRRGLSIHLGHSHSHHHHGHSHQDHHKDATALMRPTSVRRKISLVVFAACVVLAPRLVMRKAVTRAHSATFVLTCIALSMMDQIRGGFANIIDKLRVRLTKQLLFLLTAICTVLTVMLSSTFFRFQRFRTRLAMHTPRTRLLDYLFRNKNPADQVTLVGVVVNLVLSVSKFVVGVTCHSSALIADAGHSLSDLFSDFVTLYSVQLARLPPDEDHPYGHYKFEAIGSLFLALTLLVTGLGIGTVANQELMQILRKTGNKALSSQLPTPPALLMAGASIVSKEWLYRITKKVGDDLNSQVVIANAWHHRTDAYSSILALLSIGLAMFVPGMGAADSFAGLLVAGMICMTGADILGESLNQLTDTAADPRLETRVGDIAAKHEDVMDVKSIKARQVGSKAFMDISVEIPPDFSSTAIRAVEERIRRQVLLEPHIVDAVVRATSSSEENVVVCPLLEAQGQSASTPTVTDVEQHIRSVIAQKHEDIQVDRVAVHYQSATSVDVDVNMHCMNGVDSLSSVRKTADALRDTIRGSRDDIGQAHIFLDLNAAQSETASAASVSP